ncbi:MAG: V-type ATP synthase subunit I [Firmicutes bacterium]|nr:V-type ATP synthase subunit I [Bacillota bacterium]
MSISKMQRVAVIGLDTDKEKLMSALSDFGAVELTDQSHKLEDEEWQVLAIQDENNECSVKLDQKLARAQQALDIIEKYDKSKAPLFSTRRRMDFAGFKALRNDNSQAQTIIEGFLETGDKIHSLNEKVNKLEIDILSLIPWVEFDLPMALTETKDCNIHKGVLPVECDVEALSKDVEQEFGQVVMKLVHKTKEMQYVAFMCTKELDEAVVEALREKGFTESVFKELNEVPTDALKRMEAELAEAHKGIAELADKVEKDAHLKEKIQEYYDVISLEAEKQKNKTKLLKTAKTFLLEGWVPAKLVDKATEILEENQCYYIFRDPLDEEDVPVLMENSKFITPFESVTEMYSLPNYRGFDPTAIFSVFYIIFFGIMLSDAAYGIIMTIACFIILKKYDLEGMAQKLITLFMYCGVSTTFWGALFGGWFGDIVTVVGRLFFNAEIVIKPLWFNPMDDPIKLLIFSIALGIVHLFTGMGIKSYMQIKEGKWFDALCDQGFWIITITGICAWLGGGMIAPALVNVGMYMAIAGLVGLLLTGGRHSKGIGKVIGGLSSVYDITSYLSDILSYSRILALGLATGVIAQVVNTMGSIFGGGIIGAILLLIIFVFGHTLNIAINVLGAYVHTCRLQYVEFFGKFYIDGGEPFEPMGQKTKYIRVMKDK